MGMRSGTTFKKRQKEIARMEKQRDKLAKRLQRKAEKLTGDSLESSDGMEDGDLAAGLGEPGTELGDTGAVHAEPDPGAAQPMSGPAEK